MTSKKITVGRTNPRGERFFLNLTRRRKNLLLNCLNFLFLVNLSAAFKPKSLALRNKVRQRLDKFFRLFFGMDFCASPD